jgi:hypothetical protein
VCRRSTRTSRRGSASRRSAGSHFARSASSIEPNADVIEAHREATLDFDTGLPTQRRYTQAKVIDTIFLIEGM